MLASAVTLIVRGCARVPWLIIVLGLAAAAASTVYSARHFAINTDVNKLISPDLDWRQREVEFEKLFPGHFGSTLVVVDAPTAELAAQASADLTRRLAAQPALFTSAEDMAGNAFFSRNGLLFRPADDVVHLTQGLRQAGPLIGTLVADPSLRGLTRVLSLVAHRRAKPFDRRSTTWRGRCRWRRRPSRTFSPGAPPRSPGRKCSSVIRRRTAICGG